MAKGNTKPRTEAQLAVLRKHAFHKGETGNPAGRPSGFLVSNEITERLKQQVSPKDTRTKAQKIADVLIEAAMDGDIGAIKEIMDRTEGRPKQVNEHTGLDGSAILIDVQAMIDKVYAEED